MARIVGSILLLAAGLLGCGGGSTVPKADQLESVESWVKKLRDPKESPAVRTEAMQVLGFQGAKSPEVIDAVVENLNDKGSSLRHTAIITLQKLGAKSAIPRLKKMSTADPDAKVKEAAKSAIETLEALP